MRHTADRSWCGDQRTGQFLILAGGLPIDIGGEVVGGIDFGGTTGGYLDAACVQVGLDSIGTN
jgi:uncharacterized protein GlcG (DUF336 family)